MNQLKREFSRTINQFSSDMTPLKKDVENFRTASTAWKIISIISMLSVGVMVGAAFVWADSGAPTALVVNTFTQPVLIAIALAYKPFIRHDVDPIKSA